MAIVPETEQFHPTVAFGWSGEPKTLHQLWVGEFGTLDWRELPVIIEGPQKKRTDAIAGFVPEDEE